MVGQVQRVGQGPSLGLPCAVSSALWPCPSVSPTLWLPGLPTALQAHSQGLRHPNLNRAEGLGCVPWEHTLKSPRVPGVSCTHTSMDTKQTASYGRHATPLPHGPPPMGRSCLHPPGSSRGPATHLASGMGKGSSPSPLLPVPSVTKSQALDKVGVTFKAQPGHP